MAESEVASEQRRRSTGVVDLLLTTGGLAVVGAVIGITWAAALRAYMVGLAGSATVFSWWGTFGAILTPGAISGALLAVAWRRSAMGRASAWFAFAPAPLAVATFLEPGALWTLLTTGLGGGAIGVVATGLLGGFAAGQRGPVWVRALSGAVWAAMVVGFALTPALVAGLPPTDPRGAWLIVLAVGLMFVLSVACIAPFRSTGADAAASA
ncbi:hypothetical protein [Microbacterium immunditiarum]|uniref:Uncharacterized protein n=1 Tax=Microbacterium immunditiarum TaxID=337480 RepID=A0A7Y9GLL7_9MICO|nr:hypothetical protein [Microbacterium immunditiarum]NYE18704.1 hypothetical protein [Microbacterium immunditiarum]